MRTTAVLLLSLLSLPLPAAPPEARPRIRELGVEPGVLPPGPLNAITDVQGVRVGHRTLVRGESVRTGVTAILPHGGNRICIPIISANEWAGIMIVGDRVGGIPFSLEELDLLNFQAHWRQARQLRKV